MGTNYQNSRFFIQTPGLRAGGSSGAYDKAPFFILGVIHPSRIRL